MIAYASRSLSLFILLSTAAFGLQDGEQEDAPFEPLRFGDPEALGYTQPFFAETEYDPAILTPDSVLGQPHGTRLSHHEEILACFEAWAGSSDRVVVQEYAQSHEGRRLIYAVITSRENHARLDSIRADLARLHDPRDLADAEAQRILAETPPVAWMGYSIHGDELSGCDAAIALGYHLTAGRSVAVEELLQRIVVVIDPIMNPDGRERIVSMVEQSAGLVPNLDYASMHRGRWPFGRGNHYLFDINRDWMTGTQPETRGRWKAILSFHPQLLVDAHEMGSLDTFLFYPQAAPINPHLPPELITWQRTFAQDAGRAFDALGWAYYTREWADGWAPFYSDAWGSLAGATGILYEQASTAGFPLRRASGRILTYRESVHHHAVASLANLETLAARRDEVLSDYLENKRRNVAADTPGNDRVLVVHPGGNVDRIRELVRVLDGQGVEVFRAKESFEGTNARGVHGEEEESKSFPKGSLLIPSRQPMGPMVRAYLEFDQRMDAEALLREREDIERKGTTRIYDLTSWSLPLAFDLSAWWCDAVEVEQERLTELARKNPILALPVQPTDPADATRAILEMDPPPVAWVVHGTADASVAFAARAMELGLRVHVSDEPFTVGTVRFPFGSLLIRRNENQGSASELTNRIGRAAQQAKVGVVYAVASGLSPDEGPDLGGQHFHLLARPRVALLSNAPFAPDTYGHLWHHLDRELGLPFTILDAQSLASQDLRRYNVLIVPPREGNLMALLEPWKEALTAWIQGGGTLIACGNSAASFTRDNLGLSAVVLRRNALEELARYEAATEREWAALRVTIDEDKVWGDEAIPAPEQEDEEKEPTVPTEDDDEWMRKFSPYGVTLRGVVRPKDWITAGLGAEFPCYFSGSYAFLSRDPVRTPIRLAPRDALRLGGLVWPEARERIGGSAWLTVESSGKGQIILFAAMPALRGYHKASGRVLSNAVVFGPGVGANQPLGW